MKNLVITIEREFGSGGKYIGERLSEDLNLKFYDEQLLERVSKESNIDISLLEEADEKQKGSFWYTLAMASLATDGLNSLSSLPNNERCFIEQSRVIEKIAETESCVIIGRCSNIILKDRPNVIRVFIYASNMNFKINRKMKYAGLGDKYAAKLIQKTDKERAAYFNYFTNEKWGRRENYDLMIDTSKIGVDNAVELIKSYIKIKNG